MTTKTLVNNTTVNAIAGRKENVCRFAVRTCGASTAVIKPRGSTRISRSVCAGLPSRIDQLAVRTASHRATTNVIGIPPGLAIRRPG